jgi:hypothetical protein
VSPAFKSRRCRKPADSISCRASSWVARTCPITEKEPAGKKLVQTSKCRTPVGAEAFLFDEVDDHEPTITLHAGKRRKGGMACMILAYRCLQLSGTFSTLRTSGRNSAGYSM